jgi:bifunctional DNase/RNase
MGMEIPVILSRVLISETSEQQIIVLSEADGTRSFPVVIGISEALAIDRRLKGISTPRPLTHELLGNVIEALDARLEKIVINDLRDGTFYAELTIRRNSEVYQVDSRPSDAIALGIAQDVPIFVEDHVLDEVAS